MSKSGSALFVALLALCAAGCGSGENERGPAGRPAGAEVHAGRAEDRQIGFDVKHYLIRNCPSPDAKPEFSREERESPYFPEIKRISLGTVALCDSISTIAVDDTRVTIRSGLKDDAEGRAAGKAFCLLIYGSDVADSIPGHELLDSEGGTIEVCPVSD